jgi:hypothetical protein
MFPHSSLLRHRLTQLQPVSLASLFFTIHLEHTRALFGNFKSFRNQICPQCLVPNPWSLFRTIQTVLRSHTLSHTSLGLPSVVANTLNVRVAIQECSLHIHLMHLVSFLGRDRRRHTYDGKVHNWSKGRVIIDVMTKPIPIQTHFTKSTLTTTAAHLRLQQRRLQVHDKCPFLEMPWNAEVMRVRHRRQQILCAKDSHVAIYYNCMI